MIMCLFVCFLCALVGMVFGVGILFHLFAHQFLMAYLHRKSKVEANRVDCFCVRSSFV